MTWSEEERNVLLTTKESNADLQKKLKSLGHDRSAKEIGIMRTIVNSNVKPVDFEYENLLKKNEEFVALLRKAHAEREIGRVP